eukprot:1080049-Pyramimonas_sp.AAC.1
MDFGRKAWPQCVAICSSMACGEDATVLFSARAPAGAVRLSNGARNLARRCKSRSRSRSFASTAPGDGRRDAAPSADRTELRWLGASANCISSSAREKRAGSRRAALSFSRISRRSLANGQRRRREANLRS